MILKNILSEHNQIGCFLLGQGPVEQSSTNKPLAMRVVEDALAYSKKPPVI